MSILDWPNQDRPREKLLRQSEKALTDAELIAIFLNTGSRGKTALDLARDLLKEFGSLKKLSEVSLQHLLSKKGLGPAKSASLKAALELGRRSLQESLCVGQTLNNSQATRRFIHTELHYHPIEVFACLFMDNHFRLIAFEKLFQGTVNQAGVYPREIARRCLELNAVHIILAHNHPSGIATPSLADKEITSIIVKVLQLVEVDVVDHIIIGNPDSFSFADGGLL